MTWTWKLLLSRLGKLVKDEEYESVLREKMDEMLEALYNEDFFGTEGQSDPRGDHRE